MGRKKILSRLERLDELIGLLKAGEFYTVSDLANRLSVTPRTLMRDLDVLRDKGYPIEASQGRGGGIWLRRHWGIGRLNLNYREVIDLLLSMAVMEKIGSPIFLGNLKAIRHKISVSFPQEQRDRIQALRRRILVGELASQQVLEDFQNVAATKGHAVYEAFFEMKELNITYEDAEKKKTKRIIEPHYLLLNWPVWYVLAWDHLRNDARCFRLDRIRTAKTIENSFRLINEKKLMESIEDFASAI
ncbi:helix-turn-helix transcriptional regulator [Gimesia aquarii]|uniref:HTH domain protein n=1 Tax=Gimesia aquarii TaxID=2527964 RepID=A0A517WXM6_9PLAN|nr:WYL domain-containing protein [Gimesia aquarii]QDU10003.1 HTH domain protein [Gimesia aquarii]